MVLYNSGLFSHKSGTGQAHHPLACRYRMPSTQQFAYFFAFIGAGLVFMILAFSVFLPVIVLAPSKFALSFTIGSLLVMAGFAALRGLKQQASHMLSASRLPFTAGTCAIVLKVDLFVPFDVTKIASGAHLTQAAY